MWRRCSATGWPPARSTGATSSSRGDQFQPGDPYQFFLKGKGRQLLIHPRTYELLEFILIKLRDEGEDATFEYIRRELLGRK